MTAAPARRTELGLIVMAGGLTAGAYVLTSLARTATIPAHIGPFLAIVLGLLVAAHIATRRLAPNADPLLLPLAGLLNGLGYVEIARLDQELAATQATWVALGIAVYIGTLVLVKRVRDLEQYRYLVGLAGIALLLTPLLPGIGRTINGARLWLRIGPFTFQPGEVAKICLAIFVASYLVEKREILALPRWKFGPVPVPDPKHAGPLLLAWGASLVVMLAEKDLGSSMLIFASFLVMVWLATGRTAYLAQGLVLFGAGAYTAYRSFAHVRVRVANWLNPWADPQGDGYQPVQATFAMAWGGVAGTGLGRGNPGRIPAASTDYIFAALAEELGLFGGAAILIAYLVMVGAGLRIALRAEHEFDKLLAAGLTAVLGIQTFLIVGGVVRLVPLTGITLPFVSYGGSSLVANYALLALLVRISDGDR